MVYAADGLAGIERFGRVQPDLVILDWMLPRRDGLDVLRTIRQAGTTPVLMLTARGEEADRVIGLELGADDYLPKPFGKRAAADALQPAPRQGGAPLQSFTAIGQCTVISRWRSNLG